MIRSLDFYDNFFQRRPRAAFSNRRERNKATFFSATVKLLEFACIILYTELKLKIEPKEIPSFRFMKNLKFPRNWERDIV